MLVAATPETAHPVSDQCEAAGMPCLSTVTPWQPWFFGRAGRPDAPFRWTYNFFWGLDDVEAVYADMWDQVRTNKTVRRAVARRPRRPRLGRSDRRVPGRAVRPRLRTSSTPAPTQPAPQTSAG